MFALQLKSGLLFKTWSDEIFPVSRFADMTVCKRTTKCVGTRGRRNVWNRHFGFNALIIHQFKNDRDSRHQKRSLPLFGEHGAIIIINSFFSSFHEMKQRHLLWKWSKMCCVPNKCRILGKINMDYIRMKWKKRNGNFLLHIEHGINIFLLKYTFNTKTALRD